MHRLETYDTFGNIARGSGEQSTIGFQPVSVPIGAIARNERCTAVRAQVAGKGNVIISNERATKRTDLHIRFVRSELVPNILFRCGRFGPRPSHPLPTDRRQGKSPPESLVRRRVLHFQIPRCCRCWDEPVGSLLAVRVVRGPPNQEPGTEQRMRTDQSLRVFQQRLVPIKLS